MAFDERGVFELSWKNASSQKSSTANQLSDYTIFWCENDKDRPYQCNVCKIKILRENFALLEYSNSTYLLFVFRDI